MRSGTADVKMQGGDMNQYLIDLLIPITTRMGAIEDFLTDGGHPAPPPPEPIVAAPIREQEC